MPTVRHVASPTILGGCFKVRVCVYCIFTFISTDDKLTTYRPSLVTPYYVVAYPHTNGRRTSRCIVRRLPNVTPTTPRITPLRAYRCIVFRCPSHAAILIIPTVVGSGLSRTSRPSPTDSTTRHVRSLQRATSTTQSTMWWSIWWSERVDASLV